MHYKTIDFVNFVGVKLVPHKVNYHPVNQTLDFPLMNCLMLLIVTPNEFTPLCLGPPRISFSKNH